jgi:hypothetical protein
MADECNPCCATPTTTQVPGPAGADGAAGAAGSAGVNAYTTVSSGSPNTPAINGSISIPVASSVWITIGQVIFIQGSGYYLVTAKADTTHFTGTYMDVSPNTNSTNAISAGSGVSPAGPDLANPLTLSRGGTGSATATPARSALGIGGANLSVYASGTAYVLTATPALLDFGTTDPSLVINAPGVWLILARARIDNNAKTTAAVRTITLKLRRTNNTAADIANSSTGIKTAIMTTLTFTLATVDLQPIIYTTTNSDDIIQLWGSADDISGAGTFDAVEASIVAVKLYDQTV